MGAEAYEYTVPYEPDIQAALDKLRLKVFEEGHYRGAELQPDSPEAALEMTEEQGTASILDISRVSDAPDYCCAAPFSAEELQRFFGTDKPSREDVEGNDEFWEDLDRGMARYIILHERGEPKQIWFVGYSFD